MICKHEFLCSVAVMIFDDKPGNGAVDLKGHCKKCGVPLVFHGRRGASAAFPVASVDRTELRAPVTFGDAKFILPIQALFDGPELAQERKQ